MAQSVEEATKAWQEAFAAAGEARNTCSRAVRDRPAYGTHGYEEYQRDVMGPLLKARDKAMLAEKNAKQAMYEAKKQAEEAGTFVVGRDENGVKTMTKLEDGKVLTAWDRVTVGKSKTVWDVTENMYSATGNVELHRQTPWKPGQRNNNVIYRKFHFNQLTKVEES
jgi:hypothetical protein